jgi:hypothetical protein
MVIVPLLPSRHATRAPPISNRRFPARAPFPCGALCSCGARGAAIGKGNECVEWACVARGAVGLLLGLWFRVPALIAASGITAALCLSIPHLTELST